LQTKCAFLKATLHKEIMSLKCFGIVVWLLFVTVSNATFFLYLWYRFSHAGEGSEYATGDGNPSNLSISVREKVGRDVNTVADLIETEDSIGSISGRYKLVRVTPSYQTYLESFGTPTQLARVIMLSKEEIILEDDGTGSFSLETISGNTPGAHAGHPSGRRISKLLYHAMHSNLLPEFKTSKLEFDLGKRFTTPFGRRGVLDNIAFRTQPNVLFFRSHQPDNGWNITSKMIFTAHGMVNVKKFLNHNVTAKKYYKRDGIDLEDFLPGSDDVLVVDKAS